MRDKLVSLCAVCGLQRHHAHTVTHARTLTWFKSNSHSANHDGPEEVELRTSSLAATMARVTLLSSFSTPLQHVINCTITPS